MSKKVLILSEFFLKRKNQWFFISDIFREQFLIYSTLFRKEILKKSKKSKIPYALWSFRYPTNDHHQLVEQNQRLPQEEATKRRRESRIVEWVPEVPGHHHDLSRDHNNGTTWWHKGHGHDTWSECAVPWWRYVSIQMWNAGTILVSFFVWN